MPGPYLPFYRDGADEPNWQNAPDVNSPSPTPAQAAALNNLENGVQTAQADADTAQATANSKAGLGLVVALGG